MSTPIATRNASQQSAVKTDRGHSPCEGKREEPQEITILPKYIVIKSPELCEGKREKPREDDIPVNNIEDLDLSDPPRGGDRIGTRFRHLVPGCIAGVSFQRMEELGHKIYQEHLKRRSLVTYQYDVSWKKTFTWHEMLPGYLAPHNAGPHEIAMASDFNSILLKRSISLREQQWCYEFLKDKSLDVRARYIPHLVQLDDSRYLRVLDTLKMKGRDVSAYTKRSFIDVKALPVHDIEYTEVPTLGSGRGSFEYWSYCVVAKWPRKCKMCKTFEVFPNGSGETPQKACYYCNDSGLKRLYEFIEAGNAVRLESFQAIADMLREAVTSVARMLKGRLSAMAGAFTSKCAEFVKSACAPLVEALRVWIERLGAAFVVGGKQAAFMLVVGLLVLSICLDLFRSLTAATVELVMAVLTCFTCFGCSVLDMVTHLFQSMRGSSRPKGKNLRLEAMDEPLPVQLVSCLLVALGPAVSGCNVTAVLRAVASARGIVNGVSLGYCTLAALVECLPQHLAVYVAAQFGLSTALDCQSDRVAIIAAQKLLESLQREPKRIYDRQTALRVLDMHREMSRLVTQRTLQKKRHCVLFNKLEERLAKFLPAANRCVYVVADRVEPVGIYVHSPAGRGKTYMCSILAALLGSHLPDDARLYTQTREKYMTGYHGQLLHVIDELGATNSPEERELFSRVLRWISIAEEEVGQAAVEDKGMHYASKVLMVTTNHNATKSNIPLNYPDAFFRRFVFVKIEIDEKYADDGGKIDSAKIKKALEDGTITEEDAALAPWMKFTLHRKKTVNGETVETPITFGGTPHLSLVEFGVYIKAQMELKQREHDARIRGVLMVRRKLADDGGEKKAELDLPPLEEAGVPSADIGDLLKNQADILGIDIEDGAPEAEGKREFLQKRIEENKAEYATRLEEVKELKPLDEEKIATFASTAQSAFSEVTPEAKGQNKGPKKPRGRGVPARERRTLARTCQPEDWETFGAVRQLADATDARNGLSSDDDEEIDYGPTVYEWLAAVIGKKVSDTGKAIQKMHYDLRKAFWYNIAMFWLEANQFWIELNFEDQCVIGIFVAAIGVSSVFAIKNHAFSSSKEPEALPERLDAVRAPKRVPVRQHFAYTAKLAATPTVVRTEGETAGDALSKLERNFGTISYGTVRIFGFFACSQKFCVPLHAFRTATGWVADGTDFILENGAKTHVFSYDHRKLTVLQLKGNTGFLDFACYDTGVAFGTRPSIVKYFPQEKMMPKRTNDATLTDGSTCMPLAKVRRVDKPVGPYAIGEDTHVNVDRRWEYEQCTNEGDCGMLVTHTSKTGEIMFVGMHFATLRLNGEVSASVLLSREIVACVTGWEEIRHGRPPLVLEPVELDGLQGPSAFVPDTWVAQGRIPKEMRRNPPTKTKYEESPIARASFLEGVRANWAPACLGDKNDPRCEGLSQHGLMVQRKSKNISDVSPYETTISNMAQYCMFEFISIDHATGELHSVADILGGKDYKGPVPRATSIGWPMKLRTETKGKRDHVLEVDGGYELSEVYQEMYDAAEASIRSGVPLDFVAEVIAKDEVLPNSKNDVHDMRTITLVPLYVNMLLSRYFGDFVSAHIRRSKSGNTPFIVGMDPDSASWDAMVQHMNQIGSLEHVFAGDYGRFEYSHTSQDIECFGEHVEAHYKQFGKVDVGDALARRTLLQYFFSNRVLLGSIVCEVQGEFLSGLFVTTIFNCFCATRGICAAWCAIIGTEDIVSILGSEYFDDGGFLLGGKEKRLKEGVYKHSLIVDMFKMAVCVKSGGDDHIVSVNPAVSDIFYEERIAAFFSEHGRKYTPAEKTSVFRPNRPITEVMFLGRHTLRPDIPYVPGVEFYSVLETDRALKQLVYVSKVAGDKALQDNAGSALRSLWAHGPRYYNELRVSILRACEEVGYVCVLPTYESEHGRRMRLEIFPESFVTIRGHEGSREFCTQAFNQAGRGTSTISGVDDVRRFFHTIMAVAENRPVELVVTKVSKLRLAHSVAAGDMGTVRARALKLSKVEPNLHWLQSAGVVSTGGWWYVEYGGLYFAADGNNRTCAMKLAMRMTGKGDAAVEIPVRRVPVFAASKIAGASPAGCSCCGNVECDCISHAIVRMEMETISEAPVSVDAEMPVVQPMGGSSAAPDCVMNAADKDLSELLKRKSPVGLVSPSSTFASVTMSAIGALTNTETPQDNFTFLRPFPHTHILSMYAMFSGSTRFTSVIRSKHRLVGSVQRLDPNAAGAVTFGHHAGVCPQELTTSEGNFTSVQMPYLNILNGIMLPTTAEESKEDLCSTGCITLIQETNEDTGYLFASIGDDAMPCLLTTVPALQVIGRPAKPARYDKGIPGIEEWLSMSRCNDGHVTRMQTWVDADRSRSSESKNRRIHVEMERVVDAGRGMNFVDTVAGSTPNVVRLPAPIPESINDPNYAFPDMLQRVQRFATYTWGVDLAPKKVAAQWSAPYDFFVGTASNAVKSWRYFRGGLTLRFNVQSDPMQSGLMLVTAIPLRNNQAYLDRQTLSLATMTLNPHVYLRAGSNSVVEMHLPYVHPKPMLDPNDSTEVPTYTILMYCLNPLLTGEDGNTRATIAVHSHFTDVSLNVVKPVVLTEGGALSTLSENVANVARKTVDVAQAAAGVASMVQDKPNIGLNPMHVVQKSLPYFANSTNVEYAQVLAAEPSSVISPEVGMLGTPVNETKLSYLTSKWTMFAQASVSEVEETGAIVISGPICPVQLAHAAKVDDIVNESLLGYLSLMYSFWSGPIELKFEFVGNSFHKMRFMFCLHVGGVAQEESLLQAMQQSMVAYDYDPSQPAFTVQIPWRAATSWLRVPPHDAMEARVHSMGEWSLRVDTPLMRPPSVANSIAVNVSIRGGPGFKLHGIYENSLDYVPLGYDTKSSKAKFR